MIARRFLVVIRKNLKKQYQSYSMKDMRFLRQAAKYEVGKYMVKEEKELKEELC